MDVEKSKIQVMHTSPCIRKQCFQVTVKTRGSDFKAFKLDDVMQ